MDHSATCTAFDGDERFASGARARVAVAVRERMDARPDASILVFDDASGQQIDFDLRGSESEILARLEPAREHHRPEGTPRGPGRPRLGVVAREVTLLPRHWAWLATQPGGASVALRKLVEEARRSGTAADDKRAACERAYRFMSAIAGNRTGFEEAARALFANDRRRLAELIEAWPRDIREHTLELAGRDHRDGDGR